MSSYPSSWFRQGSVGQLFQVGKRISLSHPQPTNWEVVNILHEHAAQLLKGAAGPSLASLLLRCTQIGGCQQKAMMRIVMQIPEIDTELEDSTVRAKQAYPRAYRTKEFQAFSTLTRRGSTITPRFIGYCDGRQGPSGLVPGGFLSYYAWEIVPGSQLGDYTGKATMFWTLGQQEREEIRAAFRETFVQITAMGIWPDAAGAANLVWDFNTRTLYWVGFRNCDKWTKSNKWDDAWLAFFDLVKTPNRLWLRPDWNHDTSGWIY